MRLQRSCTPLCTREAKIDSADLFSLDLLQQAWFYSKQFAWKKYQQNVLCVYQEVPAMFDQQLEFNNRGMYELKCTKSRLNSIYVHCMAIIPES